MIIFQSSIHELAREIESICTRDVSYRIDTNKFKHLGPLVEQVNLLLECIRDTAPATKKDPFAASAEEKQILTSFISQLPQGIILCDAAGSIVLCNSQANNYFSQDLLNHEPENNAHLIDIIDKNLVEHALDEINARLKREIFDASSHFLIQKEQVVLQTQVVPIFSEIEHFTGFVLILSDITQQSQAEKRIETLLHTLSKNARSPLASIRAAIEAMTEFPDMDDERQMQFKEIIRKESLVLSDILDSVSNSYASLVKTKESLQTITSLELLESISRRSRDKLGITFSIEHLKSDEDIVIKADPFSFITAFLFLLGNLQKETGLWEFTGGLSLDNRIVCIDIAWHGKLLPAETLRQWEILPLTGPDSEPSQLTLKDVLDHHQAAMGTYPGSGADNNLPHLRCFLPSQQASKETPLQSITLLPESRTQISDLELFSHSADSPELDERLLTELAYTSLIREINQAHSTEEVMGKHSQLPRLIHSMITSGTKIRTVTWLVSAFADAILTRLLDLAIKELGPSPVPFAFLCLGSEGRNEQTLKTDQDNAIVFKDSEKNEEVQKYFLNLGEKLCIWLDQAGYDLCRGGIMANNPKWCQPLSTWKTYFSQWLHTNEPENLLHATIFFDFRFAYGERSLADELTEHLHHTLPGKVNFYRSMAQSSMNFKPPIGLFGMFKLTSEDDHVNCLDIKKAITPIVDYARIFSLHHGIKEISTQNRIYQLYLKKVLSRQDYNEIEQMYSFLMQMRFMGQIEAVIQEKIPPHNFIDPKRLSTIERKMLKEILINIKDMQAKLCLEFTGSSNCLLS